MIEVNDPVVSLQVGDPFRLAAHFENAPNRCGTQEPDPCPPPIDGIGVRGLFEGTGSVRLGELEQLGLPVQAFTYDDYSDLGTRDRFAIGGAWLDAAGVPLAGVGVILVTDPGFPPGVEGPLASDALPTQLALADWSLAILNFVNEGPGDALGQITAMHVRVVPEPGAAARAVEPVLEQRQETPVADAQPVCDGGVAQREHRW